VDDFRGTLITGLFALAGGGFLLFKNGHITRYSAEVRSKMGLPFGPIHEIFFRVSIIFFGLMLCIIGGIQLVNAISMISG
jgi:hypothetical protein